jgi:arsenite methyltransferase
MVAFVSNKREVIFKAVQDMYTQVATCPLSGYHFPVGRDACRTLGYPDETIAAVPPNVVESFAGVGYPFAAGVIRPGDTVLDLGSGSGTDVFIATRRVGPAGKVYALDMTAAMRAKLVASVEQAGLANVVVIGGNAEQIPLPDASVDVVTTNGVLNLVPDKPRAIAEIHRVLKPGGRLQLSDIALARPVSGKARRDPKLWAECVVGAVEEEKYLGLFRDAGFKHIEHVDSFDYFAASNSEDTRLMAGYLGAHSVTLRARKPQPWEHAGADAATLARIAGSGGGQLAGIGGAVAASAACFGAPALISAATAIGATALTDHATLYPIFVGSSIARRASAGVWRRSCSGWAAASRRRCFSG